MSFNNIQTDTNFILGITKLTDGLISDMYTLINNKDVLKFKIDKLTILNINKVYEQISNILTDRFNFNIKLKHKESDSVIYSIYPNYSYTNVINAVDNFKKLYPDKDNILFNITKDKLTKQAIDSMDVLRTAIDSDLLSIDIKKYKIYGLENTTMNIFIDIKHILDKSISSTEMIALLLKEIGIFFKDIYKINTTYSNNSSLLKSLYKLNPNKLNNDKIKILLNRHLDNKIDSTDIVSVINDFNINYKKDIDNVIDDNDKSELDFVNDFNLGDSLSAGIVKIHTIKHYREFKSILGDSFKLAFMVLLIYVTFFTLLIINIFIGIGAIIVLSLNAVLLLLSIIFKTTFNIFSVLFGSSNDETVDVISVIKDITHLKRNLVLSLRDKDIDKESVKLQISNIDIILNNLNEAHRFNNRIESKDKLYGDSNTLIENLNGNDLHYLAEKLKG